MGAFNDLIIDAICPACGRQSAIRCQIHLGASFDGDSRGRFAHHDYRLGRSYRGGRRAINDSNRGVKILTARMKMVRLTNAAMPAVSRARPTCT
jgi:hypothetical protein